MNLGTIDTDTIAAGVRKAVKEDPRRQAHGDTRYNAFFISEDGDIYGHDSVNFLPMSMPGEPAPDAVSVHSHSGQNWRWYEKLTGEKEPFNPLNAGDLKALKAYLGRGVANTMALIMGDGRMQVLHVPPEAQERFTKFPDRSIMKGREGTQQKRRELYFTKGLTLEDVEGTFLRDFVKRHGLELHENLRWKEPEPEPFIEKKRRGVVPERLWEDEPVEETASTKYYVSGYYHLIPPELWPVVPVQPELEIERRGQRYTWQKARPEPVQMRFFGLGVAPASVWKSTLKEFTERTPKGDYPALSSELNWLLQRTKVTPEGHLRVFRGRLPAHMQRKLREWLSLRYRDPDKWLEDKRIKIDFRDGRTVDTYSIRHPFYFVAVSFYDREGTVQITEDRANYHADAVRDAIGQGKPVPLPVLEEYAPFMQEAEEALYSSASLPAQMRFFGLGNNGLSGRSFHCLSWQVNPYSGDLRCGQYATACQAKGSCAPGEQGRIRVCVTPKMVHSKFYKKRIQRCAKYAPICGAGCITGPPPKPARMEEPKEKEIRAVAEWLAQEQSEIEAVDPKWIAREVLSRGGIRAYRKRYPGQKTDEEYMEIPLFLKKRSGLPPDEMASEMGFDTDSELYEAIHAAYPPKTAKTALQRKIQRRKPTWSEFEERAYQYLISQRRREAGLEGRRV